ncbi:MAG: Y-family DNA polymerase [Gammaproteobacteria bacterium]
MIAIVDCNNFYASCERLFRPDLRNKPIIVLSSGDGCIIARSNEARALGLNMGDPHFKIKRFCEIHRVHVFSSNFTLYRDLSQRVMSVIEDAWDNMEIYSVDEAFLDLSALPADKQDAFCASLQKHILKCTGIPVSIGLGKSKTLAKLSNYIAKRQLKVPVFNITYFPEWLKKIKVGDVWGIGAQWSEKLERQGILTAYDLMQLDLHRLRKQYSVVMMRIAMELQGTSCIHLSEENAPKKSILSSRSFHTMETELDTLAQAVSAHCATVYEKLRHQGSVTKVISVFLQTNRFRDDLPQYNHSVTLKLINPTDDVRLITHHALQCLKQIYKPGYFYKKAGVWLDDLSDKATRQCDLFLYESEEDLKMTESFLAVFDKVNHRYGKDTLRLASEGFNKTWDTQYEFKSPAYTTRWTELPIVRNDT